MTEHLLHVALGPVQDFIAQARRTGDLWYGSHLISELARTAARELTKRRALLLIPALEESELVPRERTDGPSPLAVPNKLYALVPADVVPAELAAAVRDAVTADLRTRGARMRDTLGGLLPVDIDAVWDEQLTTFLDFTAAWTPLDDLAAARRRVDDAAEARRRLRDFAPWQHRRPHVPKSSLDGARETVLPSDPPRRRQLQQRYGIALHEQLDAIGLIKRVGGSSRRAGGDALRFVPVINIALAPWVDALARAAPALLDDCRRACLKGPVQKISTPAWTRDFPFEASVLLPSRWPSLLAELGIDATDPAWTPIPSAVDKLHAEFSPYEPYVACLVADGDRMGEALDRIAEPDALRAFSRELSRFAQGARRLVEDRRGALVYAGGDDVLAFVPVASALDCAAALRDHFTEIMRAACPSAATVPTLSVGLGVGHYMESMGSLLELGRRAERLAKAGERGADARDALAVIVNKRSGGERSWRMRWPDRPCERLAADLQLLRTGLPARKIHELGAVLRRLPERADDDAFSAVLTGELRRTLSRARAGSDAPSSLDLDAVLADLVPSSGSYASRRSAVAARIDRLLIARAFDEATPAVAATADISP